MTQMKNAKDLLSAAVSGCFDLHVHTNAVSRCAQLPPEEVVRLYEAAGYQGIAITEHFYKDFFADLKHLSWEEQIDRYWEGYRRAKAAAGCIQVLRGMEFRSSESDNDYLVFGLTDQFLKSHPHCYRLSQKDALDLFRANGALVVQAHPARFRPGSAKLDEDGRQAIACRLDVPESLDGIEVYNGNTNWTQDNSRLKEWVAEYPHFLRLASSDSHQVQHIGRAGVVFEEMPQNEEELVQMLKDRSKVKLYTAEGANLAGLA